MAETHEAKPIKNSGIASDAAIAFSKLASSGLTAEQHGTGRACAEANIDHGNIFGLGDDDHTQYLNTTRHDTTTRHTLGTIVPHDSHANLSGVLPDQHHNQTHSHGSHPDIGPEDHHSAAVSVTSIATSSVVGTDLSFAREDHVHGCTEHPYTGKRLVLEALEKMGEALVRSRISL